MSPWQFTLFRIIFGSWLAAHLLHLAPWAGGGPGRDGVLTASMASLAGVSLLFAAGQWRKPAAVVLGSAWAALFFLRPDLIAHPSSASVALLLGLTLGVPGGEPWSRGPHHADWSMPEWVFRTAWILLAAGHTFQGLARLSSKSWTDGSAARLLLENPPVGPGWMREAMLSLPEFVLELLTWGTLATQLLFLPLALGSRSRPWIWLTLASLHLGLTAVTGFGGPGPAMLMLHLFTFDPAWLRPRGETPVVVRFDGQCLMCSRGIRFIAEEDRARLVRFKPLDGAGEPDSMLVETGGRVLDRSEAVLAVLEALGGHWRALAMAGRVIPRALRDAAYRFVAARRYRWFGKGDACSMPGEALRERLIE